MTDSLDPMEELAARADAAAKLALAALEMLGRISDRLGYQFDLSESASAFLNSDAIDDIDPQVFRIEKRSREIVAGLLIQMEEGRRALKSSQ